MSYESIRDPKSDGVWRRKEPESPCIKVCVMHPESGLCIGCLRTIDEIAGWKQMSADARHAVLDALQQRAPLLRNRKGGRAARLSRDAAE